MRRFTLVVAGLLVMVLTACSALPLPARIDLRAQLGSEASGSFQEEITEGRADDISMRHPEGDGQCVSFDDVDIPVTVERARLHYNVRVGYDGPELTGRFRAQLYASDELGDLWSPENRVGPGLDVKLDRDDVRLAGTAVLNRDQIDGINARELCWGVEIEGRDVSARSSGTATFTYDVQQLMLNIRFSVF